MRDKKSSKKLWFIILVVVWLTFTISCYLGVIKIDTTTLSGSMLAGFLLTSTVLTFLELLKSAYDRVYSSLTKNG